MNNHIRVAAYARVSTEKEDQTSSLESQKKYFTDYILYHEDWQFAGIYYDIGISGTQTKYRTGFNRMINAALTHGIDLILTKEVSRFARNTVDALYYTRLLKNNDIGVIFTLDNIDTRECDGELRLTIMASLAQEESRKTSERVKWGQHRKMEQGVVFGRDLLGYSLSNGILTINEKEALIVRRIFHKYTNEGKGAYTIAKELTLEGIKPKYGSVWSSTAILRLLKNEKYAGDLCQQKTYTPNYLTHQKLITQNSSDMIYIPNHHPAIIDRALWNQTKAELQKRSHTCMDSVTSKYTNRYWCSGKIICSGCGNKFVSRSRINDNGSVYHTWKCYSSVNNSLKSCHNTSVNEKELLFCMNYLLNLLKPDVNKIINDLLFTIHHSTYHYASDQHNILQEQLLNSESIDNIINHNKYSTHILNEVLYQIKIGTTILPCGSCKLLFISLKDIPVIFKFTIHSHGKGNNYITDIINLELL